MKNLLIVILYMSMRRMGYKKYIAKIRLFLFSTSSHFLCRTIEKDIVMNRI